EVLAAAEKIEGAERSGWVWQVQYECPNHIPRTFQSQPIGRRPAGGRDTALFGSTAQSSVTFPRNRRSQHAASPFVCFSRKRAAWRPTAAVQRLAAPSPPTVVA